MGGYSHTLPKENVANIRKNLMEEYRSGKYSDNELMGRYHMSKDAFYNSVEKYKDAVELADFIDESKAPKNPQLKKKQAKFEAGMEVSGKNLKPEKLKKLSSSKSKTIEWSSVSTT